MVKAVVHQAHGGGRGSIPNWAKSTFKLVSEWKKRIRKVVTVSRNLTSSYILLFICSSRLTKSLNNFF